MKVVHNILCLALLTAATVAFGADREQFTLKDGRVIVGSYDEATQTLLMESPKASLHVDLRDILKREEAPPPIEPKAKPQKEAASEPAKRGGSPKALLHAVRDAELHVQAVASNTAGIGVPLGKSKGERKEAAGMEARTQEAEKQYQSALSDFYEGICPGFSKVKADTDAKLAEAARLESEATDVQRKCVEDWLSHANLEEVAVPALPRDPRESEVDSRNAAQRHNDAVRRLRSALKDKGVVEEIRKMFFLMKEARSGSPVVDWAATQE